MPKVLLLEDSPTQARVVTGALEVTDYSVENVDRLEEAIKSVVSSSPFDAILLDLELPDSQGLNTYLKMQQAAPNTPIIVLTSTSDEQLAIEMLRSGAKDYLIKGEVTQDWIVRSMRYSMERFAAGRRRETKVPAVEPDRELALQIEDLGEVTVVRVNDSQLFGSEIMEQLSSQLFRMADEYGKRKFILDCGKVEYLSNSVLGQLLVWDQKIRRNDGAMRICNLRREVQDQIKARKLLAQFDICIDEATALQGF